MKKTFPNTHHRYTNMERKCYGADGHLEIGAVDITTIVHQSWWMKKAPLWVAAHWEIISLERIYKE